MFDSNRRHAIVIGASIAGLLTARVLSERFERVTLIDKDTLPQQPEHRRHVPQSHHVHALLASGREVMCELFPSFEEEMLARGALVGDPGRLAILVVAGQRHCERDSDIRGLVTSRLLVEDVLRSRLRKTPRVSFLDATEVLGFLDRAGAVTGLRLRNADGEQELAADLVVDCSGRGSRTPVWLQALGYAPPSVDEQRIDMRYRSRHFQMRYEPGHEPRAIIIAATPECPRGGVMFFQESGRCLCTLAGYGEPCPEDLEGFLQFAKSLSRPELYEALVQAEAVDEARAYGMPTSQRRRYEKLRRFPTGLLVTGDAVCSFDPIYGQGMSVAALEARELRTWLARPGATAVQWFRTMATVVDHAWEIVTGGDALVLGLPEARKGVVGLINRYLDRLHACAATDPVVANAFARVAHLIDPPPSLLRPGILWRVLRGPRAAVAI